MYTGGAPPVNVSKRIFDKYDKDSSGTISRWEFGELVYELGYHLSPDELDLAVKTIDADGGGISYPEFQKWWRSDKRFEKLQLSPEELARLQQARTYFNHFDQDRGGTISAAEFRFMHSDLIHHGYPLPKDPNVALAHIDRDASGTVSFNEFIEYLTSLKAFAHK